VVGSGGFHLADPCSNSSGDDPGVHQKKYSHLSHIKVQIKIRLDHSFTTMPLYKNKANV
jgi:hypothetical protein